MLGQANRHIWRTQYVRYAYLSTAEIRRQLAKGQQYGPLGHGESMREGSGDLPPKKILNTRSNLVFAGEVWWVFLSSTRRCTSRLLEEETIQDKDNKLS